MERSTPAYIGIALVVILCCGSACTRQVSTAPVIEPSPANTYTVVSLPASTATNRIVIVQVRVTQGTGVYILGETSLPDGSCIRTELLADHQVEAWWPADICVETASGKWEFLVPLGRHGAPSELDKEIMYEIHAWLPEDSQITSVYFPFDLSGPGEE